VSLQVGESAKFILQSQASTGYQWFPANYAFNNNVYAIDVEEVAPTQSMLGAYGQFEITVTGKSAGTAPLSVPYRRYWERSPIDSFDLKISVVGDSFADYTIVKPKIAPMPIEPVFEPVLVKPTLAEPTILTAAEPYMLSNPVIAEPVFT